MRTGRARLGRGGHGLGPSGGSGGWGVKAVLPPARQPSSRPVPRCRDTAPPPAAAHETRVRPATAASPSTGQRACVVAREGSHAQAPVGPRFRPRRRRRLPEVEVRLGLVSGRVRGAVEESRVQPQRAGRSLAADLELGPVPAR